MLIAHCWLKRRLDYAKMSYLYLFLFACASLASANEHVRVCYYTNWSQYRPAPMKYFPEDVDPKLCTHVIYAFAKIGHDNTLQPYEWNDDQMFLRFAEVKRVEYFLILFNISF